MIFSRPGKRAASAALLFVLLCAVSVYAFTAGNYDISAGRVFAVIFEKITGVSFAETQNMDRVIIWNIRAPRVIMAVLAGISLASAGAAYQGCFRNPLVEPFILGASSGAAFGAALGIVFPEAFLAVQASAFVFSLAAVSLSYFLAKNKGEAPAVSLILSGVIVGSIFSAMVSILKYVSEDTQLREITFWMMGGLYYSTWGDIPVNAAVTAFCFMAVWGLAWKLNVLSMGDDEARSLGVNPEKYKLIFIVAATLMTSVCVATVGIIAWVGLMMPHAARLLMGPDNRFVIPVAAMMGAVYLIFCDTVARTLTPAEIPIGIITSVVGAPFLIWLLRSRSRGMFS